MTKWPPIVLAAITIILVLLIMYVDACNVWWMYLMCGVAGILTAFCLYRFGKSVMKGEDNSDGQEYQNDPYYQGDLNYTGNTEQPYQDLSRPYMDQPTM